MQLFNRILCHLSSLIDLNAKPHLVIGLSGGPDSVFLLHFLTWVLDQHPITLTAAHLDHGWRNNSADDVIFCQQLCTSLKVPFIAGHARAYETICQRNGSLEELGRSMRRAFFADVKHRVNGSHIVLAHQAQDQEETFFLRLLRGSSLTGLVGMQPISGDYLRPLLGVSRQEIMSWLANHHIQFLTDPSNASLNFLRNRIRHQVIPALNTADTRFSQKFTDTLQTITEEHELLQQLTRQTFDRIFTQNGQQFIGNRTAFTILPKALQRHLLIELFCRTKSPFRPSRPFLDEAIKFLATPQGGSHLLSKWWKLVKEKGTFRICQGEFYGSEKLRL